MAPKLIEKSNFDMLVAFWVWSSLLQSAEILGKDKGDHFSIDKYRKGDEMFEKSCW